MNILPLLVSIIVLAIAVGIVTTVLYFVFGLAISFYKIYLKPKPKELPCTHDDIMLEKQFIETDKPYSCLHCGARL